MTFIHAFWMNSGKSKQKDLNQKNAIYGVLHVHEGCYITAFFAEHAEFTE